MADEPIRIPIEHELDLHAFPPRDVVSVVNELRRRGGRRRPHRSPRRPRPRHRRPARHGASSAGAPPQGRRILGRWRVASGRDRRPPRCRTVIRAAGIVSGVCRSGTARSETGANSRGTRGHATCGSAFRGEPRLQASLRNDNDLHPRAPGVRRVGGLRSRTGRLRSARPSSAARGGRCAASAGTVLARYRSGIRSLAVNR